ncbi:thioredoxin reductase [Luteibacter jiangsuensis]|uniref:Thioredoxin reductase n=1 Tax=Luteibacter jiangsuensis TaxID=637577 RepID=A0ABT9T3W6_9GAMM|nr:ArsO family NAD(P)H-dependent flavin-containing monooxygenase [Luteibacter jiangsuensis]MDQ0011559.1 thioredoxin reductase [Luteibacter jiangsuensis]
MNPRPIDVAVIGGGQTGLTLGYFLKRRRLDFVIFDDADAPGGAWRRAWPSLRLFSPAAYSSIAGWPMPSRSGVNPSRDDVIGYLTEYESRYALPLCRPCPVQALIREGDRYRVVTDKDTWSARAVILATGTWRHPYVPDYPGRERFAGTQVHSAHYTGTEPFRHQRVLVVGGGNSGAQILAELSLVATTTWVTPEEPRFLPDEVDGRALFEQATARWRAQQAGETIPPGQSLGDIVMVPPVKEARARGDLVARRPFVAIDEAGVVWPDGKHESFDAIIWCTGFRPATDLLEPMGIVSSDGRVRVEGGRALDVPGLWLAGYGDWTGPASATLMGITRYARDTVDEVVAYLSA